MSIEQIQIVLFAAYDLRKTLTREELQRPIYEASFDETVGDTLGAIIETLEQIEEQTA